MNLQEYAEAEGLKSAEAIRKRIKAHGRTVKEFTDRKGQLTEEGKATLDAWKLEAITAERDHLLESLRKEQDTNSAQAQALIQAQQLHAAALITDGTERPRRGLFSWLRRKEQPEE